MTFCCGLNIILLKIGYCAHIARDFSGYEVGTMYVYCPDGGRIVRRIMVGEIDINISMSNTKYLNFIMLFLYKPLYNSFIPNKINKTINELKY